MSEKQSYGYIHVCSDAFLRIINKEPMAALQDEIKICINPDCGLFNTLAKAKGDKCERCGNDLLLQHRYRVTRVLQDKGGYSTVYTVDDAGIEKVLKVLRPTRSKNPRVRYLFRQEARILREIDHPGIPKVDGYFQHMLNNGIRLHCIVMEKIDGSDLKTWVVNHPPLTEEQALKLLEEAVALITDIHACRFLHRDLKPPNFILNQDGKLVLIDFGASTKLTFWYKHVYRNLIYIILSHLLPHKKSDGFRAMEQEWRYCSYDTDFYSLARCFVFYLTKKSPADESMYDTQHNLQWRQYTGNISSDVLDVIDKMMAPKPRDRYKNGEDILHDIESLRLGRRSKSLHAER